MNDYLQSLIQSAKEELESYKPNSQDFGKINALFIKKLLDEDSFNHLFIQLVETKKLYLPVISASLLFLYEKNYQINIETEFEIGDRIYLKRQGITYSVIAKDDERYTLENEYEEFNKYGRPERLTKRCNPRIADCRNGYIKVIHDTNKRGTFEKIISFLSSHLKIEQLLFDFSYKMAIVCHKQEFINDLRHTDWHKSIPYRYLTKDGKAEDNLPINPLIYIASDYQTIRDHIFDKGEQLELVIFFDKYNDTDNISKDIREKISKSKKCLFIGEDELKINPDNLLKWQWTPKECHDFYPQDFPMAKISPVYVQNSELLEAINRFIKDIEEIEQQYTIQLSALKYYAKRALLTVVPEINTISIKDFLFDDLYSAGLDTEEIEDYAELFEDSYQDIIKQIHFEQNEKAKRIQQLEFDYLVVSKNHKQVWQEQMPNKTILTYSEWQKNKDKQKKVLFLGLYGYTHYKTMQNSHDNISILIYADSEEDKAFDFYQHKYNLELDDEYHSEDRKTLSGISYPIERLKKEQTFEQEIFFDKVELDEDITVKQRNNDREEVFKKFIFNDNTAEVLAISRHVLIKQNDILKSIRLSHIKEGDEVGVYHNVNKDKLESFATEQQKHAISECKNYAKLWKNPLISFYQSNYYYNTDKLLADLQNKGANIINIATLNKWLDMKDKSLFPSSTKSINAIAELVNDVKFNENLKEIHKKRRLYRSIMIALGRDFSDAISRYITNDEKTELLKRFSDTEIQKILKANIAIKQVVKIIEPNELYEPITLIEDNSNKDTDTPTQEENTVTNEEFDALMQEMQSEDLLKEAEAQAESLNNSVDTLELDISGKLDAVIKENQDLKEDVKKLTAKLQEAEGKIDSLATMQKNHHATIKKLIEAFKTLNTKVDTLRNSLK